MGFKPISFAGACAATVALSAGLVGAGLFGAGTASAAPEKPRPILVTQTPNAGITVSGAGISGGFSAPLAASAVRPGVTRIALEPTPGNACATSLRDARVGVTWRNTTTHKTNDVVFPACAGGRPSAGAEITTGPGRITFTTTVLGKHGNTFTVVPGSGSFQAR